MIDLFVERGAIKPPEVLPADALVNATLDKDAEKVRAILAKVRSGTARIDINFRVRVT